jgi:hypothetical protein
VFAALAYYLLGTMLYVLLSALILFRWVFRPMHPAEMGAPWWINMGAVAIATLAGARLMARTAGQRPQSGAAATVCCTIHCAAMGHQHLLDSAPRHLVYLEGTAARSAWL